MSDLVEFLLARIAEDETVAREQQRINGARYPLRQTWLPGTELGGLLGVDPARVLAECEAKRRSVSLHDRAPWVASGDAVCGHDETRWPCSDLRLLALPYANHPDFREEWKP